MFMMTSSGFSRISMGSWVGSRFQLFLRFIEDLRGMEGQSLLRNRALKSRTSRYSLAHEYP